MYTGITTTSGADVLTYDYVQSLREADKNRHDSRIIYAQAGCQEKFLASNADITIFGGQRGGGKSAALILEAVKDVQNKNFSCTLLRHEKDDLLGLISTSGEFLAPFGKYNRAINEMTWRFYAGGELKFSYFSDSLDEFKKRFQGKQFSFIGIDEITHIPYDKFKYLITCNRNAHGLRNRIYGTCNPDPYSWVRTFIDWWIGDDGYPVDERDGVVRYCFMNEDKPTSVYWGDTRQEVYDQCSGIIDPLWKDAYARLGFDKLTMFIKSATFIRGRLEENLKLISSDPAYVANLAQQGEEQRSRDLEGNWDFTQAGDDIISAEAMDAFFSNPMQPGDSVRRASADVALEGGDKCVLWFWRGNHAQDVFVCALNSKDTISAVKAKLNEWDVRESDFTYDLNGLGQLFKGFFPKAVPFNNNGAVLPEFKNIYGNIKSQCAYKFAQKILDGELSINPSLLTQKFSGKGYKNTRLKNILQIERKCIRQNEDTSDKGFSLITKRNMKLLIGHSPDFIESMLMKEIFHITKQHKAPIGLGWI
jgi:hypothetical protein